MTIEVGIIVSLVGAVCTVTTLLINRLANARKDGKDDGEFKADMKYVLRRVDELYDKFNDAHIQHLVASVEMLGSENGRLKDEVDRLRGSNKRIHERLDEHLHIEHKMAGKVV